MYAQLFYFFSLEVFRIDTLWAFAVRLFTNIGPRCYQLHYRSTDVNWIIDRKCNIHIGVHFNLCDPCGVQRAIQNEEPAGRREPGCSGTESFLWATRLISSHTLLNNCVSFSVASHMDKMHDSWFTVLLFIIDSRYEIFMLGFQTYMFFSTV